jgi:hypothetical protein
MRTLKYFLSGPFFFLFIYISIYAQTAEYEYTFTFSDESNNTEELILGKDPFGTDGVDILFGEEFIPQVQPGEFGVRFQLPPDTSITTIKDIRFGCYMATAHEHLADINYAPGSSLISVVWEWGNWLNSGLMEVMFINPYDGQTIASYSRFSDSSHFYIPPALDKIKIWILYNGTLSTEEYHLISPNGGELIEAGQTYTITWWNNQLGFVYNIEFSSDSGINWSTVLDSASILQNSYDWLVPQISSNHCLIRVGNYPCAYDKSDSLFTISYPVSVEDQSAPAFFSLKQNYPNPFNSSTTIKFTISPARTKLYAGGDLLFTILKVYDVLGNEVATLVDEYKSAGGYEVDFNSSNLSSGMYLYRLQAGSFVEAKKMILLK